MQVEEMFVSRRAPVQQITFSIFLSFLSLSLSHSCRFVKATSWRVITSSLCGGEKRKEKDVAVCQLSWSERSKQKAVGKKGQRWRVPFKNAQHVTGLHHIRDSSLRRSNQTAIAIQIESLFEWHLLSQLNLLCSCSHNHFNAIWVTVVRGSTKMTGYLCIQTSMLCFRYPTTCQYPITLMQAMPL